MDALQESDDARRPAARSRSAPDFCRPQPAPPRPYRPSVGTAESSSATAGAITAPPEERPRAAFDSPPPPSTAPKSLERPASHGTIHAAWGSNGADEDDDEPDAEGAGWIAIGRGVALLLGTLLLVDLFASGGLAASGPWWLDTRPLPSRAAAGLLGTAAACLLMFAMRGALPRGIRGIGLLCVGLLIVIAIKDATVYYGLLKRGDLHHGPAVAFSLHVVGCLGMVLLSIRGAPGLAGLRGTLLTFTGFAAALLAFPIAQIACQGTIDARQSAATVLVAGPRPFEVDATTRMQVRIDRAVELHEAGLVPNLLLTGTANQEQLGKMRERAVAAGVPTEEVEVIPEENVTAVLKTLASRYAGIDGEQAVVLVVSDPDHLPRLLLAGRSAPVTLAGVPCESEFHPVRSVFVREITALWRCYFRQ